MAIFSREVQRHLGSFSYANIEIEAESFAEAQDRLLHLAQEDSPELTWLEGQAYGERYEINVDECFEI